VTTRIEWMRAAWPVVLLMLFAAAFREQGSGPSRPDLAAECSVSNAAELPVLETCWRLQSDDIELMIELAGRYESAARWTDAARVYRRALEIDAGDGDVRARLARVLFKLGDVGGARREGEAALAVQPGNPVVLNLLERAAASAAKP